MLKGITMARWEVWVIHTLFHLSDIISVPQSAGT